MDAVTCGLEGELVVMAQDWLLLEATWDDEMEVEEEEVVTLWAVDVAVVEFLWDEQQQSSSSFEDVDMVVVVLPELA